VTTTFDETLVDRVEAAIAAANAVSQRSRLLCLASRRRREGAMTTVCAWCGSFAIDAQFFAPGDGPNFVRYTKVTHGICPACLAELQQTGRSR
jgi:hypothetical protein